MKSNQQLCNDGEIIMNKLWTKITASCECMTKSPDIVWHDTTCLYKVLQEASDIIGELMNRVKDVPY